MLQPELQSYENFFASLSQIPRRVPALIIGIDGHGGSGKSTFARTLQKLRPADIQVIEMDDFYLPSEARKNGDDSPLQIGGDFDWQRLRDQVLLPLSRAENASYQRYDWDSDTLAEWHDVKNDGIVIIEGIYSTREELRDFYDYTIWVDCSYETRLQRGIERDGEEARDKWVNEWMPKEDIYVKTQKPHEKSNMLVEGS
jgi:uridine kinase